MAHIVNGRCLCGHVRFTVQGPFEIFHLCHCSRCRKATASAHASNIFTDPDRITWVSGVSLIRRFDLPNAERFSKCFCTQCGSALPYISRNGKRLIIPAGVLDDDPIIRPQDNIFWANRAPWYDEALNAKRFEGYPNA